MKALEISLTEAQSKFLELKCSCPAFVAGLGSGKSYVMGLAAVTSAHHSKRAVVGVYEPTYKLISKVAIPTVKFWLQQFGYKEGKDFVENKNEHTITSKNKDFGDFLFISMSEPDTIIGYETSAAHVDELDTLNMEKAELVWDKIRSRNRLNLLEAPPEFKKYSALNDRYEYINQTRAYTSPEGYKFCYNTWVVNGDEDHRVIHGCTRDNPAVTESYIEARCKGKSRSWIEAYIEGQFRNFSTGSVYYNFNRELHDTDETVLYNDVLNIGIDFNINYMAATVFVRRLNEWHAVDEFHHLLDTPALINAILAKYRSHKIIVYPDSTGKNRNAGNASISQIQQLRNAGFQVRAKSHNPRVDDRISATVQLIGENRFFVNVARCPETVRCLEQQAYKEDGKPDKDSGTDHQNDATTYPIAYECPIREKVIKMDFSFAQKSIRQTWL